MTADRRSRFTRVAPWLALLVLSAGLHLWDLGGRTFHHDEAIHAKLSWDLLERGSYRYDPTYHGPLLYYSDRRRVRGRGRLRLHRPPADRRWRASRMVWIAWRMRRIVGGRAAWWTGLLFTVSPLFLYYGRFDRMDLLEALCASAALLAWWDVLSDRRRRVAGDGRLDRARLRNQRERLRDRGPARDHGGSAGARPWDRAGRAGGAALAAGTVAGGAGLARRVRGGDGSALHGGLHPPRRLELPAQSDQLLVGPARACSGSAARGGSTCPASRSTSSWWWRRRWSG